MLDPPRKIYYLQLYFNLKKLCEKSHKDLYDFIPITFVVDFTNKYVTESAIEQFINFFNTIERNKALGINTINNQLN